jgi:hypothetical protein
MSSPQRITKVTAVALALGAIAAPAASAGPIADGLALQPRHSAPLTPIPTSPKVVQVSNPSDGFDWGDAAIGAGGGVALSILGVGGALALSQRRTHKMTALGGSTSAVATS